MSGRGWCQDFFLPSAHKAALPSGEGGRLCYSLRAQQAKRVLEGRNEETNMSLSDRN